MKRKPIAHQLDGIIALLLFAVFAACVLAVLLTGADAYRLLTERDQVSYDRRTCVQYVATRVRQADRLGGVSVEDFGGVQALVLADEGGYGTWVYCYDGYIMELYTDPALGNGPQAGERIMPASALELRLEGRVLTVDVTGSTGEHSGITLALRSGEGAAP